MYTRNKNTILESSEHIYKFPVLIIRGILWFPALVLVRFLLKMEVKGKEYLENIPNGRVIFAANHCSEIDPYAFQYALTFPSKFVPLYFVSLTKKYYSFDKFGFRSFLYGGLFFRLMGAYPVYKGLHNFEKAFQHHIKILEMNHSILMFPEGRKHDAVIGEAKPGIIYLAKRTNSIIVPVKIEGTAKLDFLTILLRRRKITITFCKPIEQSVFIGKENTLSLDELKKYANDIMNEIKF